MRSTINLDDQLLERARALTGTKETAALVRQAPETLVRVPASVLLHWEAPCRMQRQTEAAQRAGIALHEPMPTLLS